MSCALSKEPVGYFKNPDYKRDQRMLLVVPELPDDTLELDGL